MASFSSGKNSWIVDSTTLPPPPTEPPLFDWIQAVKADAARSLENAINAKIFVILVVIKACMTIVEFYIAG